ncbi:MAG: YraN family protein [Candidatus Sericytochromatia bacterium]|nr:YraN family protein [Candidatus Sericytochromatia bacterium]
MHHDTRHQLGIFGEGLARGWLFAHGWDILERNWRCPWGEIDLIANDHGTRVFVEVKTRQTQRFGSGSEAVHYRKQQKIRRAASAYLRNRPSSPCRFDVISIAWGSKTPTITHTRDAF